MTTWILIAVFISSTGMTSTSIDGFPTLHQCNAAGRDLQRIESAQVETQCVRKGARQVVRTERPE